MGICISAASSQIHETEDQSQKTAGVFEENYELGSVCSKQGSKGVNQDAAVLHQGYAEEDGAFGGVFDGHGKNGHFVSTIVKNRLPRLLLTQKIAQSELGVSKTMADCDDEHDRDNETRETEFLTKNYKEWEEAIISAFKVMDKEIKLHENLDCSTSGTTAVVAVKQGEELVMANLGDSRAVLGSLTEDGKIRGVQLTTDLKPGLPEEEERIKKCNGRVMALKEEAHIQRVWLPNEDAPGLAMSRAFGDFTLKEHGIIAIPELFHRRLTPLDQFVILATDGVWDVLSNNEVAAIVWEARSEEAAAKAVVEAAEVSWKSKFPNSKVDDCSVVCLFFQKMLQVGI